MKASTVDVAAARADTPGCEERIHFNNAGASLMPRPVIEAVIEHLELEARIGGYEAAEAAHDRIEAVYTSVARLVNCAPREVALLENATRAWDAVFYALSFRPGDRILTARAEYCSNYMAYLQVCRSTGAEIVVIDDDEHGQVDTRQLQDRVDERTALISITHVPTSGGLVNPAAEVGRIARTAGVPFLLDACQSIGQIPLDIQEIGCDFMSATGRKFLRGPRGTGVLCVRDGWLERLHPTVVDVRAATWVERDRYELRSDARRFETWEVSYALRLGLGRAVDYALDIGVEAIWRRVEGLAASLRRELAKVPSVEVHDLGVVKCGIVTFSVDGWESHGLRSALSGYGVNVDLSEVVDTRLDFEARNLGPMIRASVHYFNTEDEIARFVRLIRSLTGSVPPTEPGRPSHRPDAS
jgi:cysteine desulfurase / selenocysteine lyase